MKKLITLTLLFALLKPSFSQDSERFENIWPVVGIRNVNDNTFIGGDIYHKGAAMLNNLRCIINNDSLFFSIIKGFYNKYKYKTIGTKEFTSYVNESTGNDYTD